MTNNNIQVVKGVRLILRSTIFTDIFLIIGSFSITTLLLPAFLYNVPARKVSC
jgi:hypothetical protein